MLLGHQIECLIGYKKAGERPDELSDWLNHIPSKMRRRFAEIGLLNPERVEAGKLLIERIEDFVEFLKAKNNTPAYIKLLVSRINIVLTGCKFLYWSDINPNRVQRHLSGLRNDGNGISGQTFNHYLTGLKVFCNWIVQNRIASENPLQFLKGLNVRTDRRHDRKALSVDELRKLLETTATQPERFGMSGYERFLLYKLAIETGLRRNELKSLTVGSFDFDKLTVKVEAGYSKYRREDILPLRHETASILKSFFTGKTPGVKVFNIQKRIADMIQEDLKAAGIVYKDESGRYADFHSLRHDTGKLLAAANVSPKVAQKILRHSDINLTLSRYTHTLAGQEAQAVESLPGLSLSNNETQTKAG